MHRTPGPTRGRRALAAGAAVALLAAHLLAPLLAAAGGCGACDDDGDGLTNAQELAYGTDLANWDTDGDGWGDGDEVHAYGSDPLVGNGLDLGNTSSFDDADGDGLSNGNELRFGTDPYRVDTDGDGYGDGVEIGAGSPATDPYCIPSGCG